MSSEDELQTATWEMIEEYQKDIAILRESLDIAMTALSKIANPDQDWSGGGRSHGPVEDSIRFYADAVKRGLANKFLDRLVELQEQAGLYEEGDS